MFKINKSFRKANIPKTIRFTEELDQTLAEIAEGEEISFNELVLRCCQYAIEHYEGNVEVKQTKKTSSDRYDEESV